MTKKVEIFFSNCTDCPFYIAKGFLYAKHICYNPSFETEKIIRYSGWSTADDIDIPEWCPLENK